MQQHLRQPIFPFSRKNELPLYSIYMYMYMSDCLLLSNHIITAYYSIHVSFMYTCTGQSVFLGCSAVSKFWLSILPPITHTSLIPPPITWHTPTVSQIYGAKYGLQPSSNTIICIIMYIHTCMNIVQSRSVSVRSAEDEVYSLLTAIAEV